MKGKVKYVKRSVWYKEPQSDHWSSYEHATRCTNTYAVLTNGDKVDIAEDDIHDYYGCSRITNNIIYQLSCSLRGEIIEYSQDYDGNYSLNGYLSDYI